MKQTTKTQLSQGIRDMIKSHSQFHNSGLNTQAEHKKLQLKLIDIDYEKLDKLLDHYDSITTLKQHQSIDRQNEDHYEHCQSMCQMVAYYIYTPRTRLDTLLGRLQKEASDRQTVAQAWQWCCEYMQSSIDWQEMIQYRKKVDNNF